MSPLGDFFKKPKENEEESPSASENSQPPSSRISELLSSETIVFLEPTEKKSALLKSLVESLCKRVPEIPQERAFQSIMEREKITTTFMPNGIALPHARLPKLNRISAVLGIIPKGFNNSKTEDQKTHFVFLFLSPEHELALHLKILSKASWLFQNESLKESLLHLQDSHQALSLIQQNEHKG